MSPERSVNLPPPNIMEKLADPNPPVSFTGDAIDGGSAPQETAKATEERWRMIKRLRARRREQAAAKKERGVRRFNRGYEILAHIAIGIAVSGEKNPLRRTLQRFSLEKSMHVPHKPRI